MFLWQTPFLAENLEILSPPQNGTSESLKRAFQTSENSGFLLNFTEEAL